MGICTLTGKSILNPNNPAKCPLVSSNPSSSAIHSSNIERKELLINPTEEEDLYGRIYLTWLNEIINAFDNIVSNARAYSIVAQPNNGSIIINLPLAPGKIANIVFHPLFKELYDEIIKRRDKIIRFDDALKILKSMGIILDYTITIENDTILLEITPIRLIEINSEKFKTVPAKLLTNPICIFLLSILAVALQKYIVLVDYYSSNGKVYLRIRIL